MKHILLLSYYYPPYTGIEGNRISSWANTLSKNEFKVTVITRQWKGGGQHEWKDYFSEYEESVNQVTEIKNENLSIIRVPYKWNKLYKFFITTPLSSAYYWSNKVIGNFHIETNAYAALKVASIKVIKQTKIDFIIVSSPPLNIVRLGKELKTMFKIPLVVDFRDSFNNHLLNPGYKGTFKERLEDLLFTKYLKKWIKKSDIITSVSEAVLKTLPISENKKTLVITNGYESDTINSNPNKKTSLFIISLVGSLYVEQDLAFMTKGLSEFIRKVNSKNVLIQFIGLKRKLEIRKIIEDQIESSYLFFTDRVSRVDAINYMHTSNILLQVGWKGYKGYCPGKVFEYLASKRHILIAPGDGDLTDKIVSESNAGVSVHSKEEMVDFLFEKYKEWEENGFLKYSGDENNISEFSRDNQNIILVKALMN